MTHLPIALTAALMAASPAYAIEKVSVLVKPAASAPQDLPEKMAHLSLGNCLPLDAVLVNRDTIAFRLDCDGQAYAFKAMEDVLKMEGVERILGMDFETTP
jgi:hypothetical protein